MFGNALLTQCDTLVHAEAVLFVDHNQSEVLEGHAFLEKRMCADRQAGATILNCCE